MTKKMEDKSSGYLIPESILSDLCSRFIINVPEEERHDLIRIFFQIEIAHWFYLDFYCESSFSSSSSSSASSSSSPSSSSSSSSDDNENDDDTESNLVKQKPFQNQQLKPCSIRTFAENIFRHCPFLMQHSSQLDEILSKWKVFKHAVPTNGAIILDESMRYVLLVQGFWAKASWGFPKGKVFEEETEAKCAMREVLEETGYDISNKLVDDDYLQININDQTIRLYIITDVSKSIKFEPKTRREIKEVRWFPLDELPIHRKDVRSKHKIGYSPNSFFMVIPFVKSLKKWISVRKGNMSSNNNKSMSAMQNVNYASRPDPASIKHRRHNSHTQHNNNSHHYSQNNYSSYGQQTFTNSTFVSGQYKQISKSNESISSSSNLNLKNSNTQCTSPNNILNKSTSTTKSNAFLKHFSGGFSPNQIQSSFNLSPNLDNLSSNQANSADSPYYQKVQQKEFAELLKIKEAASAAASLANNNNNLKLKPSHWNSSSKFKPVNTNSNNQSVNTNVNIKPKQQQVANSNTNSLKHSASFNFGFNMTNNQRPMTILSSSGCAIGNQQNVLANFSKVKKQLEFNGPECWVNFKFDYDSIVQNLPSVLEL